MNELVDFLRARLDEDYEAARLVLGVNIMAGLKHGKPAPRWVPSPEGDAAIWDTNGTPHVKFVWARERDHIIRHDPARVLAEVEADRKLIAEAERIAGSLAAYPGPVNTAAWMAIYKAVQIRAEVHANHPDYQEAWRP